MAKFKIEAGARHAPRPMQVLVVENETYQWLKDNNIDLTEGPTGFDLQNFSEEVRESLKESIPFTLPDSEDEHCAYPADDYANGYSGGVDVVYELIGLPFTKRGKLNGYVTIVDEDGEEIFNLSGENLSKVKIETKETLRELNAQDPDAKFLFYSVGGDGVNLEGYLHDEIDDDGYFDGEFDPQDLALIVEDFGWYGKFLTDMKYKGEIIHADFFNNDGTDGGPWFCWECEEGHGNSWVSDD